MFSDSEDCQKLGVEVLGCELEAWAVVVIDYGAKISGTGFFDRSFDAVKTMVIGGQG